MKQGLRLISFFSFISVGFLLPIVVLLLEAFIYWEWGLWLKWKYEFWYYCRLGATIWMVPGGYIYMVNRYKVKVYETPMGRW